MSGENVLYVIGKEAGQLIASIQNALEDKKVTWVEGGGIAKELATLALPIITRRAELVAAIKDGVDLAEEEEFKEGFIEGYDITNDTTEEKIEAVFSSVVSIAGEIARIFM